MLHCPGSNLKLGSGLAPIVEMRAKGISVSLGADGAACNNHLDMFEEMRLAAVLQSVRKGPGALTARDALWMATREGARALGLEREIGSIETGKRADFLLVDRDRPQFMANRDPVLHAGLLGPRHRRPHHGRRRRGPGRRLPAHPLGSGRRLPPRPAPKPPPWPPAPASDASGHTLCYRRLSPLVYYVVARHIVPRHMMMKRDPLPFLPLTPAAFHVLLTLADGPKHGYLILKDVEERTDGRGRAQHRHALRPDQALPGRRADPRDAAGGWRR